MKVILATVLIVAGIFIWAMMQYTSMGYNGWGIMLSPIAILSGVLVATDKS
jgi:hypothetical protein